MQESRLLSHIYERSRDLAGLFPHVVAGPGSDCAAFRVGAGGPVVLSTVDQLIEGRHFRAGTEVELVARKAVARSVSDIAASGGSLSEFGVAMATAALPRGFPQENADRLFDAMSRWAREFGCPLVGGDIAVLPRESDALTLTVSVMGLAHAKRGPVLRSAARVGDAVFVTGALGGSFDGATGLGKHLTFEPRLKEAAWLCDTLGDRLHAMMDISDGLGRDAGRIAAASGVGIEIDAESVPRAAGVADVRRAIGDGEDYELLVVVDPAGAGLVGEPWVGAAMTRIGEVVERSGAMCVLRAVDGSITDVTGAGWDHG